MSDELQAEWPSGPIYFLVFSSTAQVWNGSSLVSYTSANYSQYPISGTELGSSDIYVASMPAVAAGTYSILAKLQGGGSPAESDITVGQGLLFWDGVQVPGWPENFADTDISSDGYLILASDGLDQVVVETGLNARQSLSIIAAANAGVLAGAATTTVTIAAANVSNVNRITATVDSSGDRSAVTLNIPS